MQWSNYFENRKENVESCRLALIIKQIFYLFISDELKKIKKNLIIQLDKRYIMLCVYSTHVIRIVMVSLIDGWNIRPVYRTTNYWTLNKLKYFDLLFVGSFQLKSFLISAPLTPWCRATLIYNCISDRLQLQDNYYDLTNSKTAAEYCKTNSKTLRMFGCVKSHRESDVITWMHGEPGCGTMGLRECTVTLGVACLR